ncbi:NAD(P)-binding protein [Annulohypoxylon maeteangense]|uniref:NAD(P)-binding protein n=1 Tax=Annulohypoxylon maeteangense TaxID=1927788 RepID=UPI002008699C|nr:NAD(P)-binding protein [Annulohypoxylon maeteangense]KAI0883893.1 NAD(P)-binding protein [Annulohypoxylon maeteangense]
MADKLQGTTVLVTGGGGGLGKVIAAAYLNEGANVVVCDIHEERLQQFRDESEATGRFVAINTDVTDESAVNKLVDTTVAKFGRLDIVVSNAGMTDKFDAVGSLSKENWDKIINLNLTGSFLIFKAAVNAMEKQSPSGGTIIQIGSTASWYGTAAGAAYTVSKHGVAALVKNTAGFYVAKGIYAMGLNVGGMIDTNIQDGFKTLGGFNTETFALSISSTFKPEQAVQLKDVAKYCVFLADRDIAATVTGSMINFNKNMPKA